MEFTIKFDTDKSGWPIVYIEESYVMVSKTYFIVSVKIVFVLTNSAEPAGMPHDVTFHLGLHCLPKFPFFGFLIVLWMQKGHPARSDLVAEVHRL